MNEERLLKFLGLGARAGKLVYGQTACAAGIKSRKIKLMILDGGVSDNTRKAFTDSCKFYEVPALFLTGTDVLGKSLGRPGNKMIGIVCAKFAENALEKYGTTSGGEKFE